MVGNSYGDVSILKSDISLVLFIVPPSGVIFIGILAGVTIVLGACLGWAWGTIAMKAALATRPAADLQAQYARLQQTNTRNTTNAQAASGQATYTQIAIYNGAMLDTRVSVTYFCMIGLFIYLVVCKFRNGVERIDKIRHVFVLQLRS